MSTRTLVFDSRCAMCSSAASDAQRLSGGWLVTASMHDSEVRDVLRQHAPDLGVRPALIITDGSGVRVLAGAEMLFAMAKGMGVRRTWSLLHAVSRQPKPSEAGRRGVLRLLQGSMLVSVVGGGVGKAAVAGQRRRVAFIRRGELGAGHLEHGSQHENC